MESFTPRVAVSCFHIHRQSTMKPVNRYIFLPKCDDWIKSWKKEKKPMDKFQVKC